MFHRVLLCSAFAFALAVGIRQADAYWLETQLAGVRLGDPATILFDVPGYGNPDGIIVATGTGPAHAGPETSAIAGAQGTLGGAGAAGAAGFGAAGAAGPSVNLAQQAPAAVMGPGMMGPGMGPISGAPPGIPGAMGAPGQLAPPGAVGAPVTLPGGGEGQLISGVSPFPDWVLSVWFDLHENEIEYFYVREGVAVGFVINKNDGRIVAISVAGESCDFARTALWKPHQYIQLGDDFKRVHQRYGWPQDLETFVGGGSWETPIGSASVTFNGVTNQFRRDCILWYHEVRGEKQCNVAFTLHDMRVTRIHIWIPEPL